MGAAQWKISVDRRVCVSSGVCEEIAGQWFESASDGTRALHEEIAPTRTLSRPLRCARSRPSGW
jgi:ferredoxin